MRFLSFILSLYVLALSVVPCLDDASYDVNSFGVEISHTSHDHNHDNSNESDLCTPFCTCACCGSLITVPAVQEVVEAKVMLSATYLFTHNLDYSFTYTKGVWRPPVVC